LVLWHKKCLIFEYLANCLKQSDPQVERSLNEVLICCHYVGFLISWANLGGRSGKMPDQKEAYFLKGSRLLIFYAARFAPCSMPFAAKGNGLFVFATNYLRLTA
jgi:hypothetical protein